MTWRPFFMLLSGVILLVFLFTLYGLGDVLKKAGDFSYGYLWLSLAHIVPMALSAGGWWALSADCYPRSGSPHSGSSRSGRPRSRRMSWRVMLIGRWIREGVNNLLPVAQIGGEVVGVRFLVLRHARTSRAVAATVADLTMEAGTQILFTLLGIAVLFLFTAVPKAVLGTALIGVAIGTLAIGGFVIAQRKGLLRVGENLFSRLAETFGWHGLADARGAHDALHALYRRHRDWIESAGWHLAAWIIGSMEIWLLFALMGEPISWIDALILESLIQAVRSAAFFIPAAIGVQEASYIAVGALLGLPTEVTFAASLIRRGRDIILGVPALGFWYWNEARRVARTS